MNWEPLGLTLINDLFITGQDSQRKGSRLIGSKFSFLPGRTLSRNHRNRIHSLEKTLENLKRDEISYAGG